MRALITGSRGFVGRHLSRYLQQATAWQLTGLSRGQVADADIAHVSADLSDPVAVAAAVQASRPDLVVHLASQASVADSFKYPAATLQNNIIGQLHLLEALRAAGLDPLVLVVSSNEVYGPPAPQDLPLSEAAPLHPANPYAVSKVAQEMLAVQHALSYGLRAVIVRPFNHIGPGQDARFVVPSFARQIARIEAGLQEPTMRVGNLGARRDFTDVRDMVRAYHLALTAGEPGQTYNLGSGQALAIAQLLEILLSLSRVPIEVVVDQALVRPVDVPEVVCDSSRFRAQTGWQPQHPIEQTLAAMLNEWRARVPHEQPSE